MMRRRFLRLLALGALVGSAVAGACAPFASDGTDDGTLDPVDEDAGVSTEDPGGLNTTGVGAGTGAETGLPCDVQQLVENRCIGCHLATSTLPLLSYDDMLKPSKSDPKKTMVRMALERMQNADKPMPPPPAVAPAPDEVAIFENWLLRNTPPGTTCTPPAVADAGGPEANYDTPLVCTSQTMWTGGNGTDGEKDGRKGFGPGIRSGNNNGNNGASPLMEPGRACLTCHSIFGGPSYKVAGTVYPTAHEPDDCNGVNEGVEVVITDANGVDTTLVVNTSGNFYWSTPIAAPFHVKVKQGAKERVMATALTAGDCNTCHTTTGANSAPGRVMAP